MTDIIDLIDNAISDTMSSDAMRWTPEPPPKDGFSPLLSVTEGWSPTELVDSIYRAIDWVITFNLEDVDPLIIETLFGVSAIHEHPGDSVPDSNHRGSR